PPGHPPARTDAKVDACAGPGQAGVPRWSTCRGRARMVGGLALRRAAGVPSGGREDDVARSVVRRVLRSAAPRPRTLAGADCPLWNGTGPHGRAAGPVRGPWTHTGGTMDSLDKDYPAVLLEPRDGP